MSDIIQMNQEKPRYLSLDECVETLQTVVSNNRRAALAERNAKKSQELKKNALYSESILHHLKKLYIPRLEFTIDYWEKRFPGFKEKKPGEQQAIVNAEMKKYLELIDKAHD